MPVAGSGIEPAGNPLQGRPPISYRGERVLTTELAAKAFSDPNAGGDVVTEKQIQNNFDRNTDRFEEGKHFFKVVGAELRALKNEPSLRGSVGKQANSLILWTERGIARHAKILETDTAWAIFEQLEDTYFRVREAAEAEAPGRLDPREARLQFKHHLSIARLAGLAGNQALIAANRATRASVGFDTLDAMGVRELVAPVNDMLLTPTDIGQRLGGLSAIAINHLLAELDLQEGYADHKGKKHWRPTDEGRRLGGTVVDVDRSNGTGAAPQLKWPFGIIDVLRAHLARPGPDAS